MSPSVQVTTRIPVSLQSAPFGSRREGARTLRARRLSGPARSTVSTLPLMTSKIPVRGGRKGQQHRAAPDDLRSYAVTPASPVTVTGAVPGQARTPGVREEGAGRHGRPAGSETEGAGRQAEAGVPGGREPATVRGAGPHPGAAAPAQPAEGVAGQRYRSPGRTSSQGPVEDFGDGLRCPALRAHGVVAGQGSEGVAVERVRYRWRDEYEGDPEYQRILAAMERPWWKRPVPIVGGVVAGAVASFFLGGALMSTGSSSGTSSPAPWVQGQGDAALLECKNSYYVTDQGQVLPKQPGAPRPDGRDQAVSGGSRTVSTSSSFRSASDEATCRTRNGPCWSHTWSACPAPPR